MIAANYWSRRIHAVLSVLAVFAVTPAFGQAPFERVLVPILLDSPVPGAFGSLWKTELIGRNESASSVEVTVGRFPSGSCAQPPCGYQPFSSFAPFAGFTNPNGGLFLYVGAPGAGKVTLALRIRDLSRQALTWGTSIPVVREAQTFTSNLQLLDVPTDARFRVALRIYDFDSPNDRAVRLRIYDLNPSPVGPRTELVDTVLQLRPPFDPGFDVIPGSAVMTDLIGTFPQLTSAQRLRIVLDPVSSDLRFWAFVSVTNDETQHVTVIVPDK